MNFLRSVRTALISLCLIAVLTVTSACSTGANQAANPTALPTSSYSQIERGNTASGQNFGEWVTQTAQGLIQDAYVRDNDKLGVVITPKVRPDEVRTLAKSLMQGFEKNFPNRDLTVLMYAPDKELILTANYNDAKRLIEYQ
ncbi:MAG: hypothetical protein HC873_08950 [Leptolyngbyaceae cyanobacterium SL_1_1]|nr:hypothetical protein [Leptolyngbyaceae cyanobacterium RM1_1_2]NJO09752.1 hypothetical protein [Leptolyngbyaceae cyanobacterium SL_1_1]